MYWFPQVVRYVILYNSFCRYRRRKPEYVHILLIDNDMASITILGFLVCLQLCYVRLQIQQEPSIDYISPKDCAVGQGDLFHEFFDYSSMSCVKCSENSTVQTQSEDRKFMFEQVDRIVNGYLTMNS